MASSDSSMNFGFHHDVVVAKALENVRAKSSGGGGAPAPAPPRPYSITINFHPDRMTTTARTTEEVVQTSKIPLLEAIGRDGVLKSQFETHTSNGGLTAHIKGGDRWLWESKMFGGAYDNDKNNQLRPKYAALNFASQPMGASPRFGSSFFVLKPQTTLSRTTLCYPDSYYNPIDFAVGGDDCGGFGMEALIDKATANKNNNLTNNDLDVLDHYIEAHIHGILNVREDVECIVLDPCYQGTIIEQQATKDKLKGIPVKFHAGYKLSLHDLQQPGGKCDPNYRGQQYMDLAIELIHNHNKKNKKQGDDDDDDVFLTPALLGEAINKYGYNEQSMKKVWHYLARYGYNNHDNN